MYDIVNDTCRKHTRYIAELLHLLLITTLINADYREDI